MGTKFEEHLAEEMKKYKGVSFPVKTGFLWRFLIKKVSCTRLHPNPDDEFTMPSVGPSYRIISEYMQKFKYDDEAGTQSRQEPIIVEKMHPDGYLIINGHHRWAAYYMRGQKSVPVDIVNLTHEEDLKEMLKGAVHDKRVTMDLDEVVFCSDDNEPAEKELSFPYNRIYKEKIRAGIPALFHYLAGHGYDIWVYSSKFYSMDYIRNFLKRYHVHINGIVTGVAKKYTSLQKSDFDRMIAGRYQYTLHIDRETVLKINNRTKDFEEFKIDSEKDNWSQGIMDIVGEFKKDEEEKTD